MINKQSIALIEKPEIEFEVQMDTANNRNENESQLEESPANTRPFNTPKLDIVNPIRQGVVVLERGEASAKDLALEKQATYRLKEQYEDAAGPGSVQTQEYNKGSQAKLDPSDTASKLQMARKGQYGSQQLLSVADSATQEVSAFDHMQL